MKVKLFVPAGGFVTEGTILPYNKPPDVLVWGQRVFKFVEEKQDYLYYEEAFCVALIETPEGLAA